MLVAAVQMTSGPDVAANLEAVRHLLGRCAEAGTVVAVLPENFALMARRDVERRAAAEPHGDGPIQSMLAATARAHGLKILLGCYGHTALANTAAAQLGGLADYLDLDSHLNLADDPFRGAELHQGRLRLGAGPGFGVVSVFST